MGIFDRLSRLLRANVHAAIDNAENPEKLLDQLIREAESAREAGQQQLVSVMAERNRIAAEAANEEKLARKAMSQAEAAARKDLDDLAREALRRRHDAQEAAEVYSQQAEAQQMMVERLKSQLAHLDTKIRRMRQERDSLVARIRAADAQKTFADAARQVSIQSVDSEFSRQARRIRREESIAEASAELYADSLEGGLDALEDEQIEAQLVSLKQRLERNDESLPGEHVVPIDVHTLP
jgi:phage shock protein A